MKIIARRSSGRTDLGTDQERRRGDIGLFTLARPPHDDDVRDVAPEPPGREEGLMYIGGAVVLVLIVVLLVLLLRQ